MLKLYRRTILCLLVLSLAGVAMGVTKVIEPGETFYMGGTGGDPINQRTTVFDLRAGATLCVTNLSGFWRIWGHVVCTNGTAYISRLESSGTLEFRRSVIVRGEGALRIRDFTQANIGVEDNFCYQIFDASDFAFVDRGGQLSTGTLRIADRTSLKHLPKNTGVTVNWAAKNVVALCSGGDWSDLDEVVLPSATPQFIFGEEDVFKPDATVKVPAGGRFGWIPSLPNDEWSRQIDVNLGEHVYTNAVNVELGSGASFWATNLVDTVFTGSFANPDGGGRLYVGPTRSGTSVITSTFSGDCAFPGGVFLLGNHVTLVFARQPPNLVCNLNGQYTTLTFDSPPDGDPATFEVSAVNGSYLSSKIRATTNQTITVKTATGKVWSETVGENAVINFEPALGGALMRMYDKLNVQFNGRSVDDAGVPRLYTDTEWLYVLPRADGSIDWSAGGYVPSDRLPWYTVGGTATLTAPGNAAVRVLPKGDVTVQADGAAPVSVMLESNAVTTIAFDETWRRKAFLWIDPNVPNCIDGVGLYTQPPDKYYDSAISNTEFRLIERIVDCRPAQSTWSLANRRTVTSTSAGELIASVYPYLVTGGPNGLTYISCGRWNKSGTLCYYSLNGPTEGTTFNDSMTERRRLQLHQNGTKEYATCALRTVVMVFGSQNGGGTAMIGTTNGAFERGANHAHALTDPITTNTAHDIWLDGVKVADPSTAYFSGGWQIVTVDVGGEIVDAFGWGGGDGGGSYNYSGGQNYGEIILFEEALTDAQRVSVESYLAKKWGLVSQYRAEGASSLSVRLNGVGSATIRMERASAGGACHGTVALDGTTLEIPASLPWSEADVPSDHRVGWFDPDAEGVFDLQVEDGVREAVMALSPRGTTMGTLGVGTNFFYGVGSRRPFARRSARGLGAVRTWIDFDHAPNHVVGGSDGNTLRFKAWNGAYDSGYNTGETDRQVDVKTVLVAMDSCRGGGTPLASNVSAGGDFGMRTTEMCEFTKPIWCGASAKVTGGTTRLNGVTVSNPTRTGFTGEPEVLSLVTSQSVKLGNLGYYGNSEGKSGYGEIIGEVLMFDEALADDVRAKLEAYLMGKWTGRLPAGYTDWRDATLTGTGTVSAATFDVLPKIDEAFDGTVKVDDAGEVGFAFALAGSVLSGAVNTPDVTYDLPPQTPLTITVVDKVEAGSYPLVTCKGFARAMDWQVRFIGKAPTTYKVRASSTGVELEVFAGGTMILVR